MDSDKIIKILVLLLVILGLVVTFEVGFYLSKEDGEIKINALDSVHKSTISFLSSELESSKNTAVNLTSRISALTRKEDSFESEISKLEGKVAGLEDKRQYPFNAPSKGIIGSHSGTFGGLMYGERHWAVDIWTSATDSGQIASHKGNPVYSACNGKVVRIFPDNAAVIIQCNDISSRYDVPKHTGVFTYYGHLGNRATKALFITVGNQQRVKKGQHIGYQGDLSSFYPNMSNVHVHFSIFTGNSESDNQGGSLNPCLYIGGDCSRAGGEF